MDMKRCSKCKTIKTLDSFNNHKSKKDGKARWCRECSKASSKLYRINNPIKFNEQIKKIKKAHPERYKECISRATKNYYSKFPEKRKAHNDLRTALQQGIIDKKPCSICGSINSQAHHSDYSKPLDVTWYCQFHHMKTIHRIGETHKRLDLLNDPCI